MIKNHLLTHNSIIIMKKAILAFVCFSILTSGTLSYSQDRQTAHKFVVETNYMLYLPEAYANDTVRWPLMLFLHGAGECGTDIEKVKKHGPPKLIAEGREYPFIVVSPQAPPQTPWRYEWGSDDLFNLLQYIFKEYRVDRDRVYLTGLSMGGFGAWNLAEAHPEIFAAVIPICGGGDSSKVWKLRHMPVWCFHGAKDKTVPLSASQQMVDALKTYNPSVKFTVNPEGEHNIYEEVYTDDSVYDWMLAQRRFVFKETVIDKNLLEEYAGNYILAGDTFKLVPTNNRLEVYKNRQKAFEMKPASDVEFFMDENYPFSVIFERDTRKKVTSFVAFENREKIVIKKIIPDNKAKKR